MEINVQDSDISSCIKDKMESLNICVQNKCAVCAEKSTSKCSNCKQVYYCTVAHQKADWRRHKSECHPFQVSVHRI